MGRAKTQYATMNAQTCTYTHRCECLREEFESRALTFKRPTESLGQPVSRHDCTTEFDETRKHGNGIHAAAYRTWTYNRSVLGTSCHAFLFLHVLAAFPLALAASLSVSLVAHTRISADESEVALELNLLPPAYRWDGPQQAAGMSSFPFAVASM